MSAALKINYPILTVLILHHAFAFVGLVYVLSGRARLETIIFGLVLDLIGVLGIGVGTHRLWSHKSFKAKTPLRIILMLASTVAGQNTIWRWVAWHRVHHRFSDTDADPHNATRGFFYSHMGWLITYDHKKFRENEKKISMEDLRQDSVVMWQKRNYKWLYSIMAYALPMLVPWLIWKEEIPVAFCVCSQLRYIITCHRTWTINSVAHIWGNRPYNKSIRPGENKWASMFTGGEGWHNYHHTFPWDYRTSETFLFFSDWSTFLINMSAKLGLAYDLRMAPSDTVEQIKAKNL